MASPRRMAAAPAVLLLLLLLVATEMGTMKTAEARTCLSQSHKFKGTCLSNSNCAGVCRTENFPDGECNSHRLERKCYCKRTC
ncbi:defensin Tk-AMP-D2 [Aegilops tauschii subsp. strangulata]|uniref:Defensin Tk-AMP-D2 n=1 Tax=Aegilops tauschii TaxID=37682 RepID=M8CHK5_AEGTA|nr:defensin Tk-AMP-D2 isoform X2 [Aegilops tauschii subsp. strangulata]